MLGGFDAHLVDLLGDAVEVLAVTEVPVRHPAGHGARGGRVATLEDLRMRLAWAADRLGLEVEVVQPVEVAVELGVLGRPDLAQYPDELLRTAIALIVL
jgi:hypothetical protein